MQTAQALPEENLAEDTYAPLFIFDLEGTITDSSHREGHRISGDYETFRRLFRKDTLNNAMRNLMHSLSRSGAEILILTAKPDADIQDVVDWLSANEVPFNNLIMREEGNNMASPEFKLDKVSKLKNIQAIFDDRKDVVDYLKSKGYNCILVGEYGY